MLLLDYKIERTFYPKIGSKRVRPLLYQQQKLGGTNSR